MANGAAGGARGASQGGDPWTCNACAAGYSNMAWRTVCRLCQAARPPRGAGTIGDAIDKAKEVKAKGKAKAVAKRVRFASDGPGPSAAAATPAPWAQGAAKQAAVEKPSSGGGKDEEVRLTLLRHFGPREGWSAALVQDCGALVPEADVPPPAKPLAELFLQALLAMEAKVKGQVGRAETMLAAAKEEQEAAAARVAEQEGVLQKRRDQLEEVAEAVRARKRADLAQHTGPSPMEVGEPEETGDLGKALLKSLEGLEAERERVLQLGEDGDALLAMAAEARCLVEKLAAADARAREAAAAERARAAAAAAERAAAAQEAAPAAAGEVDGAAGPPGDRKRVGDLGLGPELDGLDALFDEVGMEDEQQREAVDVVELVPANATAWGSAQSLVEWLHDGVGRLPEVLCLQEHRLKGKQAVARAAGWMQARGFSWHGQAAVATGPGPLEGSGGVAVATLRPSAAVVTPGLPAHRFQVCEVNLGFREPCCIISSYFITKIGRAKENIGLMAALLEYFGQLESPWLVMGDWNMEPEDVRERARSAGAALVAPGGPTCGSKVFDFAVVSQVLTGFVETVEVLLQAPTKDHVPLRVVLRGGEQPLKVGCQEWFEAVEAYLIDLHEIVPPSRWKGRCAAPLRKQRQVLEAFELEWPDDGPLAGLSVARVVGLLSTSSCKLTVQFAQEEARRRWMQDKQRRAAEWRAWAQAAATEGGGSAAYRFI
ncbi:unnamed protein product [Prorocentrum cordatum]|uniref:Endonuclease/exonuclease/phosphatase domain-containing protein n=1 Tax=Prorocentrum cordatum TaxID=2364126 RepID=A0ABN9RJ75_9DINO|nr:unnamed protein product [Polarella glacialis]